LRILYLVHNLSDPAVSRRVEMLRAGGATVALAGFNRGGDLAPAIGSLSPLNLGKTGDGRFLQRVAAIAKSAATAPGWLRQTQRPDVIIGRNLEMLALGVRAQRFFGSDIPLVYESLDIHRLLLREDPLGKALRAAEAALARRASMLVTSSPAFVREYFVPLSGVYAPVTFLENKVLVTGDSDAGIRALAKKAPAGTSGDPWKIGWFGALRCSRSLSILSDFSRRMEGRVEIVLRGRPAYSEFADFHRLVDQEPYVRFLGPYENPGDLRSIYDDVHFTWAIDFFEEGQNSSWLLPNRLYEGCCYGCVPIVLEGTETARFLGDHDLGFALETGSTSALEALFSQIGPAEYEQAATQLAAVDARTWICTSEDCMAFVQLLCDLVPGSGTRPLQPITA
jgi:hypothetical protein